MRPLSKTYYLAPMIVGWLLSFAAMGFLAIVFIAGRGNDRELVPALLLPAMMPAMLGGTIPMLVFVYKAWASIQDALPQDAPPPRTTPLMAILLLFVPFYNFYWMFQSYWGWTKDFNERVANQNARIARAPEGVAFAICILILLSAIPFIGPLFALANQVLTLMYINSGIDSVNSLIAAKASPKLA